MCYTNTFFDMQKEGNRQLDLSPFDQTGPRIYVHKFFCFEFLDSTRQAEAVERLEQCLSATILRWPIITGHVSPAEGSDGYRLALHYETPAVGQLERRVRYVVLKSNAAKEQSQALSHLAASRPR